MNRAYSLLEIKKLDDSKREISGIATTPEPDRVGDIVDPMGAKFAAELPLLWQHQHDKPVGVARFGKATKSGIPFTATIAQIDDTGALKDLVDMAWQAVKAKLVRGVSIGFRANEYSYLDTGGVRFAETEIYELSLVTIPANASATINSIKSIDTAMRAASGLEAGSDIDAGRKTPTSPGASGTKTEPAAGGLPNSRSKGISVKTIAEQIRDLEGTRVTKAARMGDIMKKPLEEGRSTDAAEAEEFDALQDELKKIDADLVRLKNLEALSVAKATPVDGSTIKAAGQSRTGVVVKTPQQLDPGIAFARAVKCLALGYLERRDAIQIAKSLYDGQDAIVSATTRLVTKAAVPAATTTNQTWAGALVGEETSVFADFVEFLRPQTILGRFGQGGVPSLRRVPFRVPLIGQTSGGDGYWVGEGQAKPLTKFDFSRTTLEPLKVANIAVATMEVVRDSSPAADVIIRDGLAAALRERLDLDFIDPAKAASAGVSPASILNGVAPIPASGTGDAQDVRNDIRALFGAFIEANNAPTSGVWVMKATTALSLSLMLNPLGQQEFPGITMSGGSLLGLPVIVSEFVPGDSDGAVVALVNASDIYMADEGGIDVDMSTEASLQMDNAPDNPTAAGTVLVSLWQRNLVGFRAERAINWARRRPTAVAYLSGVNWGG